MYHASVTRPEADDLPHGPFTDPQWRENYQWLAMDGSGVGFVLHLGTHPDDATLWHSLCSISLPDGRVFVAKTVGPAPDARTAGTALHHSRCIEGFRVWELTGLGGFMPTTFDELGEGPLRDRPTVPATVALRFEACGPVWDPAGDAGHPEWGAFHHEQPMTVRGTIAVAGEPHSFDGLGYRDHSRGPRDMREVSHSHWSNGVFPSGRTFCTLQVHRRNGDVSTRAAILHPDGREEPIEMAVAPVIHDAAHRPLDISLTLVDSAGVRHEIPGRVSGGATWSIVGTSEFCLGAAMDVDDAYILPQSIVRWEWDGEVGYGLTDRCSRAARLRDLAGQAASAVAS
jgi:hypothetical protein